MKHFLKIKDNRWEKRKQTAKFQLQKEMKESESCSVMSDSLQPHGL